MWSSRTTQGNPHDHLYLQCTSIGYVSGLYILEPMYEIIRAHTDNRFLYSATIHLHFSLPLPFLRQHSIHIGRISKHLLYIHITLCPGLPLSIILFFSATWFSLHAVAWPNRQHIIPIGRISRTPLYIHTTLYTVLLLFGSPSSRQSWFTS